MKKKLPVGSGLARYTEALALCHICKLEDETLDHLFYKCIGATENWDGIRNWLHLEHKTSW